MPLSKVRNHVHATYFEALVLRYRCNGGPLMSRQTLIRVGYPVYVVGRLMRRLMR